MKWIWALLLLSGAPAVAAADSPIVTAVLARSYVNGAPGGVGTTFGSKDRALHCVVTLKKPAAGLVVRSVWIAADAAGLKDHKIVEKKLATGTRALDVFHFAARLPRPWPVGRYRVELYVNGKKDRTLNFLVR